MFKPRICDRRGVVGIFSEFRWVCSGLGATGRGYTPEMAYRDWKYARKKRKQNGLLLARNKRLSAEKRAQDREERRRKSRMVAGEDVVMVSNEQYNAFMKAAHPENPWWKFWKKEL